MNRCHLLFVFLEILPLASKMMSDLKTVSMNYKIHTSKQNIIVLKLKVSIQTNISSVCIFTGMIREYIKISKMSWEIFIFLNFKHIFYLFYFCLAVMIIPYPPSPQSFYFTPFLVGLIQTTEK